MPWRMQEEMNMAEENEEWLAQAEIPYAVFPYKNPRRGEMASQHFIKRPTTEIKLDEVEVKPSSFIPPPPDEEPTLVLNSAYAGRKAAASKEDVAKALSDEKNNLLDNSPSIEELINKEADRRRKGFDIEGADGTGKYKGSGSGRGHGWTAYDVMSDAEGDVHYLDSLYHSNLKGEYKLMFGSDLDEDLEKYGPGSPKMQQRGEKIWPTLEKKYLKNWKGMLEREMGKTQHMLEVRLRDKQKLESGETPRTYWSTDKEEMKRKFK